MGERARIVAEDERGEGWVALEDGHAGLAVGLRRMAEEYPKALGIPGSADGIDVYLLWNEPTRRVTVAVLDTRGGDSFEVEVDGRHALDAFHERDLTEDRRWFRRSLAQRLDLRVLLRWLATHLPGDTVESIARWRRRLAACPPDPCPSLADRTVPPVEVAEQ